MENKDLPAYPILDPHSAYYREGLTKREAFAMAAMQGLCANPDYRTWSDEFVTNMIIGVTDRTLAELSKPQS